MRTFLRNNAIFIGLSLTLIIVLGLALLFIPKGELHLLLCDHHTPAGDTFFRYYTQVAEWFPYVICVAILLFGCVGNGVFASAAMVGSALVTQLFKHLINAPRPLTWFAENYPDISLPLTEGVRMNYWLSFPSGHTTSFFALFFVLSIIYTRKPRETRYHRMTSAILQIVLFILATLGGYSRIYLSQHFAMDVFGGIIVGLTISALLYCLFSRWMGQNWYNYRLFTKK
ncbi:MAG: phosphatase PAP2 family protein [Paludibacteraceae bacterium]|nr:phosphatase PAP2 family protein [Paludibacteraceae bacterium]